MVQLSVGQLVQEDLDHVIHPLYSRAEHLETGPIILVKGEGVYLEDINGKRYLDGLACLWNVNIGHGRKELAQAAAEQMSTLAYCSAYTGFSNIPLIKLAKKLTEIAPPHFKATFFTCGGAESTEAAFKTARFYWKIKGYKNKVKIIARRQAYHGVTTAAMSATGLPIFWQNFDPLVPAFLHIAPPYCYRCEFGKNYPGCNLECADALEEAIKAEGPDTVAAFIAEPVMGSGGVIPAPPEYFPRIRQICDRYNVLLIADEVITGFGRTGKWFAMQHWDVKADIMAMAKGITSAYAPLGGIMVSEEIHKAIVESDQKYMHGHTYSGHPTCCAVALKNLEIMERENLPERAARVGAYLQSRLQELADLPGVGNVRGLGLLGGVEVVADKATRAPFPREKRVGERIVKEAAERGVIVRCRNDSILMSPPLIITEEQIDQMVNVVRDSIAATLAAVS